jgi:hypothetical protein
MGAAGMRRNETDAAPISGRLLRMGRPIEAVVSVCEQLQLPNDMPGSGQEGSAA